MPAQPEENVTADRTRFLDCPSYPGNDSAVRCGLPAEIEARYIMRSTDGPLGSARIRCPRGHRFNGPIQALTTPGRPPAEAAVPASPLAPPHPYWRPS
jgi:hypothetical protein